jgi:hypothetical protein
VNFSNHFSLEMFRPEIGITAFLNNSDAKSFPCLFKHLQSDFVVQEILKCGKVCEITAEPQVYVSPEENENENSPTVSVEPPSKFTEEMQKQLAEFRSSKEEKLAVNVEVNLMCFKASIYVSGLDKRRAP